MYWQSEVPCSNDGLPCNNATSKTGSIERMCSIISRPPDEWTEDELQTFVELVKHGEEVEERGLSGRVRRAVLLAMVSEHGKIVGTGAIKNPKRHYHLSTFKNAKTDLIADDYPIELGWIYIIPSHEGRGLGGRIVDALMSKCIGKGLFATTRTDNEKMQSILQKRGFIQTGSPYKSTRNREKNITLFIVK